MPQLLCAKDKSSEDQTQSIMPLAVAWPQWRLPEHRPAVTRLVRSGSSAWLRPGSEPESVLKGAGFSPG